MCCVLIVRLTPVASAQRALQPVPRTFQLPPVIVTAQKEPADPQTLPVSLTAVAKPTLLNAGVEIVSEAGVYAPEHVVHRVHRAQAEQRAIPRHRLEPGEPGDHDVLRRRAAAQLEHVEHRLLDVEQVEFVRGPQSALFGRNTLGGLINVTSTRPSLSRRGPAACPCRSPTATRATSAGGVRAARRRHAWAWLSLQYGRRDGFTRNDVTGNDLDSRAAFAGKGQLLWTPVASWETRLIVTGERARDGDYALSDLGGLRQNPFTRRATSRASRIATSSARRS